MSGEHVWSSASVPTDVDDLAQALINLSPDEIDEMHARLVFKVGPVDAELLWAAVGEAVVELLDNNPTEGMT